jgi:hypothetical protein
MELYHYRDWSSWIRTIFWDKSPRNRGEFGPIFFGEIYPLRLQGRRAEQPISQQTKPCKMWPRVDSTESNVGFEVITAASRKRGWLSIYDVSEEPATSRWRYQVSPKPKRQKVTNYYNFPPMVFRRCIYVSSIPMVRRTYTTFRVSCDQFRNINSYRITSLTLKTLQTEISPVVGKCREIISKR